MMKVVILCGGKGTRMDGGENVPKPLFKIGNKPVLWHIMKIFSSQGFNDFILCGGHKIEQIQKFVHEECGLEDWNVMLVDTGLEAKKSDRLKKIKDLIKEEIFFVSYGDDLSNVDLRKLVEFHLSHNKTATITGVKMRSPFGMVEFDGFGKIIEYKEKPILEKWMNGGYMVFNKKIFQYLQGDGELEDVVFSKCAGDGELFLYKHEGEWKSMNTIKDNQELNEIWEKQPFWKIW
jgi:glucose-1-phosphate cytidylyltransferase